AQAFVLAVSANLQANANWLALELAPVDSAYPSKLAKFTVCVALSPPVSIGRLRHSACTDIERVTGALYFLC
ncbi:MAG TPA: hypothetical protein VMU24_12790, partial [Candidatus Acidoferrales bacterium]|nr:hypothetical protein [Candidatus Acidoferrales bacterium]